MLSETLRRIAQLSPCLEVQVAQRQACRLDAQRARSEHEAAAESLVESERQVTEHLASFSRRFEGTQVFTVQDAQCWRALLASATRNADDAAQALNQANEELERMREELSVADAKVRLLESALRAEQRRAVRGREALAFEASEHFRRARELLP